MKKLSIKYSAEQRTLFVLFLLSGIYFFSFWPINAQGARDQYMLSVFAPDEFAQYPHLLQMVDQPADSLLQSVYRFVQYKHYYYGYPFYLYSALFAIVPLRLFNLSDTSMDLLALRQMVSVLPMLAGLGLLVYMQTKFQSLVRSVLLFLFFLSVPMVVVNNLWWHPESLVFFFIVLTLFFLQRDDFSFKRDFYFSAISCGLAVATKLIGLFFFIAIPVYIFLAWRQRRINPGQSIQLAAKFVLLMVITFLAGNPFLIFKSERDAAVNAQIGQSEATSSGFVFSSGKDPLLWMPIINEYYGQPAFLSLICLAVLLGMTNKKNWLTNLLLLLWYIPFGLYLLFFVSLRHRYYFLPVILPLFSVIPNVFDWPIPTKLQIEKFALVKWLGSLVVVVVIASQLMYNFNYGRGVYIDSLYKETNSDSLKFFSVVKRDYLSKISLDRPLVVFRSVRMYVSDDPRWIVKYRWSLASYSYIEKVDPDIIMLWKQEIFDYTNVDVINNAVRPDSFMKALPFYQDARNGSLIGYTLLYQDDFGVFYLRNELVGSDLK